MPTSMYRLVRRQEETRAQLGQMKQLKGLMYGLVNVTGDPQKQQLDAIRNARELAFLITDLQDSTAMAAANPAAFRKVQDIHDTVGVLSLHVDAALVLACSVSPTLLCPALPCSISFRPVLLCSMLPRLL